MYSENIAKYYIYIYILYIYKKKIIQNIFDNIFQEIKKKLVF